MHIKEHFQTITYHRRLVRQSCFRVGLYWQGLTHDLSKYSLTEFLVGAKYFQGDCSPNNAEKEEKGYSSSWLHHKGRNKHHFEYWIDYSMPGSKGPLLIGMKMPLRYVVEMFMDRIAAAERIGPGQASGLLGEAVVPQLGDGQHPALRARYACGKGRTGRVAVNTGQAGGVLL